MTTKRNRPKMVKTAISLKPDQVETLAKMAQEQDRPFAWMVRKAIDTFITQSSVKTPA